MVRKERAGKIVYLYEPLTNKLIPTTYKEIAGWLGVEPSSVKSYAAKKLYHHKLDACILQNKPSLKDRRIMNFEMRFDDEQWRKTEIENIEISSKGRVRNISKKGYMGVLLVNRRNRNFTVRYKGKEISANRLAYKAFIGNIPNGYSVSTKNGIKGDIRPENLMIKKTAELMIKKAVESRNKPVVFLDEQGNVIDEYKNLTTASEATFYSRDTISRTCNGQLKIPRTVGYANAFMWADVYYEKEGIC